MNRVARDHGLESMSETVLTIFLQCELRDARRLMRVMGSGSVNRAHARVWGTNASRGLPRRGRVGGDRQSMLRFAVCVRMFGEYPGASLRDGRYATLVRVAGSNFLPRLMLSSRAMPPALTRGRVT